MLSALFGGYLAAYPPPPVPPATAAAPSPSARLPAPFPAGLRRAPLLVARRRAAGAGDALSASAAASEGDDDEYEAALQEEGFASWTGGGEEDEYDHDPEIGDIMGDYFDDPKKAQTRMEDRIRKKRHKIVQTKTGSPNPIKVVFNKFDFSNSYIWFEFYNALLPKDITLISDSLRSWHIVGRLGGCNSMNMQGRHWYS